ncbi:uncharacterized protein HaLaN_20772 [Haematococcus lacustris]|uniref:Uncharacterized protein n=2 Tax=Haematococcus lacustris TaxID=44745 RepID=A0A699ZKL0_HAELA|nr:uncharacterized protein HaLaN_20772 [Haematococcus lacustris]
MTSDCDDDIKNICLAARPNMSQRPGAVGSCLASILERQDGAGDRRILAKDDGGNAKDKSSQAAAATEAGFDVGPVNNPKALSGATLSPACSILADIAEPPNLKQAFDSSLSFALLKSQLDKIETATGIPLVARSQRGVAQGISLTGWVALMGVAALVVLVAFGAYTGYKRMRGISDSGASSNGSSDSPAYWFTYRPEIEGVHDKISLLNYVRDLKGRAALADLLRKCYLTAGDDLQALKREGKIFIIGHVEPELETVFECDMMGQQVVSQDVRNLWFEVTQEHIRDRVPSEITDLQAAVLRAGLRSALANQPIKRTAPAAPKQRAKKPRQQRFNLEKATNAHLPQLFSGAQPVNIDS